MVYPSITSSALVAVSIFLASCTSYAGEEINNPLAVGLCWKSKVTMTFPDGQIETGTAIREITGKKVINGQTYFINVLRLVDIRGPKPWTSYKRNTEEGTRVIDEADPQKLEYLEMPASLSVGKSWAITNHQGQTDFKVESLEATGLHGQKFERTCKVSFKAEGTRPNGHFLFAPGIGYVRETFTVNSIALDFELRSFESNKVELIRLNPKP